MLLQEVDEIWLYGHSTPINQYDVPDCLKDRTFKLKLVIP